jgi:hypothetical protein
MGFAKLLQVKWIENIFFWLALTSVRHDIRQGDRLTKKRKDSL